MRGTLLKPRSGPDVDGVTEGAKSPSTISERETTAASFVKILGSALGLVTS
jgi:hypothetical protein